MSVKLRLRRMGRTKRPVYAVVASDSRSPRDGRFIEDLGRYNPIQEPAVVTLKEDRVLYWLDQGAQPSDTVRNLLSKEGLLLGASLLRKGRSAEEVQAAIEQHRAARAAKAQGGKVTAAQRRQEALEAERRRVAEQEAEAARQRAEAEAEAKRQEEEARRREAEARLAAEAEAGAAEAGAAEAAAAESVAPEAEAAVAEEAAGPEAAAGPTPVEEAVPAAEEAGAAGEEAAEEGGEEPKAK